MFHLQHAIIFAIVSFIGSKGPKIRDLFLSMNVKCSMVFPAPDTAIFYHFYFCFLGQDGNLDLGLMFSDKNGS